MALSSQELRIEDNGEDCVYDGLKILDIVGQGANEGLVEANEICEQVMANNDQVSLGSQFLSNAGKLCVHGRLRQLRILRILVTEPCCR